MTTKTHKAHIIGLKELRMQTEKVIIAVSKGAHFTVVRRSKPIFTISAAEENWETVIDFTKIKKSGVPIADVLKALKRHA